VPEVWVLCIIVSREEGARQDTNNKSTKTQLDEFVVMHDKEFSLVSYLSTSTIRGSAWYLENGASHHMTKSWELFSSLMKKDSKTHVELGDNVKYTLNGEGTIWFQLKSGGSLEAQEEFTLNLSFGGHRIFHHVQERESTHKLRGG
jgi:hypothetical protein